MKTVFVVNPKAGRGKGVKNLIDKIKASGEEAEIYLTKAPKDATRFVREYLKNNGVTRFIACGGDGTLSEVVNGMADYKGAEVGVIPIGSGNDFVRSLGEQDFFDLLSQVSSDAKKVDLIKYSFINDGITKDGYCINMANIGFDCNVADLTNTIKEKTFLGGSLAYFVAIFIMLVKKKGADLKIESEDGTVYDGPLLLTSLANGMFCGGGIKSNLLASLNDGLININIIKNVSRLKFISLLPFYMNGTVLDLRGIERYITSPKYPSVTITPNNGKVKVGVDGEVWDAEKIEFSIIKGGINFVLPNKKAIIKDGELLNV